MVALVLVSVSALALGGGVWYVNQALQGVPTFEAPVAGGGSSSVVTAPPLELPAEVSGRPETYLLFSTGATGIDEEEAEELGIHDLDARGRDKLTDTLMLVVLDPTTRSTTILSIPRDTWIRSERSKVNAIYPSEGPQALADVVSELTGLPVHHMISVDFAGFAALTDAVGGVSVYTPTPLRDRKSGLDVPEAGCVTLDGRQALSWVRSRYTEYQDESGNWRTSPTASDFGRIERQHAFLRQVLREVLGPRLPVRVPRLVEVAQDHLVIDEDLEASDLVSLARAFSSADPEAVEMYTLPGEIGQVGRASVVLVDEEAAAPVLSRLQARMAGEAPAPTASGAEEGPAREVTSVPTPAETRPDWMAPKPPPPPPPTQSPVPPAC